MWWVGVRDDWMDVPNAHIIYSDTQSSVVIVMVADSISHFLDFCAIHRLLLFRVRSAIFFYVFRFLSLNRKGITSKGSPPRGGLLSLYLWPSHKLPSPNIVCYAQDIRISVCTGTQFLRNVVARGVNANAFPASTQIGYQSKKIGITGK